MDEKLKDKIRRKFGSIARFANILGAPKATFYAWTRPQNRNNPAPWTVKACIDAATYRSKRVSGWSCRSCGAISEATNAAIKPPYCGFCGGTQFTPVSVIHEDG